MNPIKTRWKMPKPKEIQIYTEGDMQGIDLKKLALYLKTKLQNTQVILKQGLIYESFKTLAKKEKVLELAKKMAKIRIHNPQKKELEAPLPQEIEYEKRRLLDPSWKLFGVLYEGFEFLVILSELLSYKEGASNSCCIVITNQLIGTWDPFNMRYHARVSVYGFPSLISITGLVLAPARDREFYLSQRLGVPSRDKTPYLEHNDCRLGEALKGYLLQAIFYYMIGNPFCERKDCRLFNAHWQKELIEAQLLPSADLCLEHKKFLSEP